MSSNEELRGAVTDTLDALRGMIEETSTLAWAPKDGVLPLIRSAILRRQYECLTVAVDLVDKSQGFAAVALLRAACEEFIWAKYLASLHRSDAEQLLVLVGHKEINDSLKAQDEHAGRKVSELLGLADYLKGSEASAKRLNTQIKTLGAKLRWEKRAVEGAKLPSVAFLAKAVNETKLYRFLYHASSRYVHFSVAELLRRTWGKTGKVTVSSAHFTDYWGAFVMYWGVYLLASTFPAICELGEEPSEGSINGEKLLDAAKRIGEHGPIPIVTAEELAWEPRE